MRDWVQLPRNDIPAYHSILIWLFIFVVVCGSNSISNADYVCGDANGDSAINVGDAVFLTAYIFQSGQTPEPYAAGDVNNDNAVNVADAVYLINFIFHAGPDPCPPVNSGCKTFSEESEIPSNLDCIQYEYDGQFVLKVKHVNAGFNCCPDTITADIVVEGNTITLFERESIEVHGGCYCNCLFDVEYQVNHILPGEYTIKIVEPYLPEGDDTLRFTVDLLSVPSGQYCVERSGYPWGEDYYPYGGTSGGSGCKTSKGEGSTSTEIERCVFYEYDGESFLFLKHTNALLNCCPWLPYAYVTVSNDSIIIDENVSGGCSCDCLFDIDMYVGNLHPGQYRVIINEPYMDIFRGDYEKFDFDLYLYSEPVSGSICLP